MSITDSSINNHFADTHPFPPAPEHDALAHGPVDQVEDYSGAIVALLGAFAMGFITCLITIGVVLS